MEMKLKAYCNSEICSPNASRKSNLKDVLKEVSKYTVFCPQCGCALYWKSELTKRGYADGHKYANARRYGSKVQRTS